MTLNLIVLAILIVSAAFTAMFRWFVKTNEESLPASNTLEPNIFKKELFDPHSGIEHTLTNLSNQLQKAEVALQDRQQLLSMFEIRRSIGLIHSTKARIQQVRDDSNRLRMGTWSLTEAVESTLNKLQHTTGITTTLAVNIRPDKWNTAVKTLDLFRMVQDVVYNCFLHGIIREVHVFLEINPAGQALLIIRYQGSYFNEKTASSFSDLGLSSVMEIVHELDGTLQANNDADGATAIRITASL